MSDPGAMTRMQELAAELAKEWEAMRVASESGADSPSVGFVTATMSGIIVGWSETAASILGWSIDEALGMPITNIIPERMRAAHEEAFATARERGVLSQPGIRMNIPALRKDGTEVEVAIAISLWANNGDRLVTAVVRRV